MMIYLKRVLVFLALTVASVWLQGSVIRSVFSDTAIVPNIPLILVVFLSFFEVSPFGAVLAFAIGFEFDMFSGIRIGPWAGTFVLLFGVIACFAQRIFVESGPAVAVAAFVSSLLGSLVYLLFTYEIRPFTGGLVWQILVEAIFTGIIAPFVFKLLKWVIYRREQVSGRMAGQLV